MLRQSLVVLIACAGSRRAIADDRREDATFAQIFHGPFQSSRLYAMPVADVVGAYVLSLSAEGSLLQQPGILTAAGVAAVGFGDLAQLEYRHTAAISVTGVDAPLPAVGVQLKLPLPTDPNVPAIGIAFRLGVARDESIGATTVTEKSTDFYVVARERFAAVPWLTLHGGVRYSPAEITAAGVTANRSLWLPTGGVELTMNRETRIVGEASAAPQFHWQPGDAAPQIGVGVLTRLGVRWALFSWATFDASFGYQLDAAMGSAGGPRDVVQQWDIRLGAEVFVPWGALACRAVGAFCT